MNWTILGEVQKPDGTSPTGFSSTFQPVGEVFSGDMDAVNAHLVDLQAQQGRCFAAQVADVTAVVAATGADVKAVAAMPVATIGAAVKL